MQPSHFIRALRTTRTFTASRLSATPRACPYPKSIHRNLLPATTYHLLHFSSSSVSSQNHHPNSHNRYPIDTTSYPSVLPSQKSSTESSALRILSSFPTHLTDDHHRSNRSPVYPRHISSLTSTRRKYINTRYGSGIEKRRTYSPRRFASNSSNTATTNGKKQVTWREALESPRKAITYAGQLWRAFVDWLKHMWAGMKLLAADVRVSSRIVKKITHGKEISRRERNFIVKTGVDLARLVPFSLFLIIPLAEFALPFALRLFPNMLPSQFQDQMKTEEDMKRRLKGRLELAKYLRDVVEERATEIKASDANSELKKNAEDLSEFLGAIRGGKDVDGAEVSRFAKFFNDELTIDGAARPQLIAMCKYMGISPYGHDIFLKFKLRSRLNAIKRDDMEIMWEGGAGSLTDEEVAKACRDRGIKEGTSYSQMRKQLADWLDLSQKKEIPSSLLIMSRALLYTKADSTAQESEESILETLGSLPEDVIMDVKQSMDVGGTNNVERLQEIMRQAKLIEIESEREARKEKEDEEKRKKKEEGEEVEVVGAGEKSDEVPDETTDDKVISKTVAELEQKIIDEHFKPDKEGAELASSSTEDEDVDEKDEEEMAKELDTIRSALSSLEELASNSAVTREREELRNLKLELAEAEQFVKETEGVAGTDLRRFKSLVSRLEREVERVDAKVGLRMKLLDQDNDGLMSLKEFKDAMSLIVSDSDESVIEDTLARLDANADGNISIEDVTRVLHEMQFELGVAVDVTDDIEVESKEAEGKKPGPN